METKLNSILVKSPANRRYYRKTPGAKNKPQMAEKNISDLSLDTENIDPMVSLSSKSIGSDMASVSQGLSLNDFRRNTKINECIEATKPTLPPKRPTVRFQLSDPTEEPTIKNDKVFKTSDYDEAQTVDNDDDQFEHTRKRLAGQTPFEKNIHHEISHAQGISTSTPSHRDPLFEYDYACDISPVVVPPLTDIKSTATSYMTSNGNSVSSGAPTPLTNVTNVYKSAFVVSRSNNSHSVKLFDYENSPSFVNPNPFASTVLTSSSTVPAKPAVSQPKSNKINSISNIKKRPPQSIVSYADTTFTPDTRSQMTHREEPLQGRELVDMLAAYWSPETPAPGLAHSFLNRLSSSLEYSHCQDESLISLQSQQSYPPVPLSNQVTQASPAPFVVATPDSTAVDSDAKLTESDQSSDLVDDSTSLRTSNLRSVESEVTFEQIGESMDSITSSAQFSENVEANVESPDPDVVKVVNREESAKIVNKSNANSNVNTFISATSEYFQSAADTETKVATITRDKYASSTVVPVVSSNTSSQQQQHCHDELEENGVSLTKPTIGKRRAQLPPVEPTPDTFDILGSVPMIFPQKEGSTLGTMEPPVLEMVSFAPANVALSMTQKQQQMQLVEAHSNNNSTGELRIVTTSVISLGKTMQPPTESMFVLAGDATTSFISEDNDHDSDNDKNHLDLDTPEEGMESLEAVMATLSVSNHVLDSHTSPQQVMTNIRSTVVVKPQSDFSCLDFERTPTMVRIPPLPYSVYVKRAGLVTPLLRKFGGPVRLTMSQNKHSATRSVNPTAFTIADNSFRSDDSTAELFQQDNHSFVTNLYDQKLPVTPSSISVEYQHHGLPSAAQFSQRDGIVSEDRSQMSLDKFFASFKSSITGCEFVPVKPETHWKVPLTTIYPIQESVTERCGSDEREDTKKWIGVEDEDEDRLATDYGNFVVDKNNNDTSVTNNHYDNVSPVHAVDDSGIFTAATTMTLDLDESYAQHGHSVGAPRLALVSKCSNSSKAMDMKEIILTTNINATASSSLCFCNKRKVTMKFHSKTIMIRFEPTDRTIINPGEETQFEDVENVFSVNQKLALIKPNGELQLTVSLKPVLDVPGIYSGVLKLTTNGKSFVILLRGIVNQPVKATATDSACPLTTPTITEDVDIASIKSQSKPAPVVVTQSSTPVPSTFFATATSAFAPSNEVLSKQSQLRTQLARQKEQSPVITLSSAQKHWSQPSPIPFSSSNITRQVPANHTLSTSAPQLLLIKPTTIAPVRHIAASAGTPGLFFKRSEVNFGTVEVGTLTRVKIELCNSTNEEVTVFVGDPQLPFVVLHNEVTIRPRCYVKLPVRFLPVVGPKNFSARLVAQSADGSFQATINLSGSSSC